MTVAFYVVTVAIVYTMLLLEKESLLPVSLFHTILAFFEGGSGLFRKYRDLIGYFMLFLSTFMGNARIWVLPWPVKAFPSTTAM